MQTTKQPARLEPIKRGTWAYACKRLKDSWPWYIMLVPAVVYLCIFDYAPMYGLLMAFQKYNPTKGIMGSEWVGFKHFTNFFNYPFFWEMIENTLNITLLSLATFPCSIIFALFLNEVTQTKFKKFAQMVSYMPHFVSEVVVVSLVFLLLDLESGPVNKIIELLGGEKYYFLGDAEAFPLIYILTGLWQSLGWGSILYISALSSVPPEELEAARIDGASRFQIMWHINLPSILPTIMITFIMRMGSIMNVAYTKVLLFENDFIKSATNIIAIYTYKMGIGHGQFSYATAIGLFNNVINITILLIFNWISKKMTENSLF